MVVAVQKRRSGQQRNNKRCPVYFQFGECSLGPHWKTVAQLWRQKCDLYRAVLHRQPHKLYSRPNTGTISYHLRTDKHPDGNCTVCSHNPTIWWLAGSFLQGWSLDCGVFALASNFSTDKTSRFACRIVDGGIWAESGPAGSGRWPLTGLK